MLKKLPYKRQGFTGGNKNPLNVPYSKPVQYSPRLYCASVINSSPFPRVIYNPPSMTSKITPIIKFIFIRRITTHSTALLHTAVRQLNDKGSADICEHRGVLHCAVPHCTVGIHRLVHTHCHLPPGNQLLYPMHKVT